MTRLWWWSSPWLRRRIPFLALALSACYNVDHYLMSLFLLEDHSMEPIFSDGHLVLCRPWPWCRSLQRRDVVVARSPTQPQHFICKRVVGVEEDVVEVREGGVQVVPRGHVWLEGENRLGSVDSNVYGPVPMGLVQGLVVLRVWPWAREHTWKHS